MSILLSAHEAGLADAPRVEGHFYLCRECDRPIRHLGFDGRCSRCAGVEEAEDAACRRAGRVWLLRCTAEALRKAGHRDRARLYDEEAEAL